MNIKFLFSLLLFSLLTSCESPLLNHDELTTFRETRGQNQVKPELWSEKLNLGLKLNWILGPFGNPTQESSIRLVFVDEFNQATPLPENLYFVHYGWMPGMGHGTADDGYIVETSEFEMETRDLYFNMPGEWDLHFLICRTEFCENNEDIVEEIIYSFYI